MGVGRAQYVVVAAALLAMLVPSHARAERTRVDWQRGLLIGRGIAVGDLRSPTRQLARVKAERQAKVQCRGILLDRIASVRRAGGPKKPAEALSPDGLATLGDAIFSLETDYGTDGSVVVEMALPLDGLRILSGGPDPLLPSHAEGPSAILVDARGTGLTPAVGYALSDGANRYGGPTLFFTSEEEARKHPGVGGKAPLLLAKSPTSKDRRSGTITLEPAALATLIASRPLVAILWKSGK